MNYKIVADSSCDLSEELMKDMNIELVPFKISVEGKDFIDNKDIDMKELMEDMKNSSEAVQTACPSPGDFLEAYEGAENIFVVTISKNVSGAYNSAILAKQMFEQKYPEKFIHVFDSKSASTGEILSALKIKELVESGKESKEIVEIVEEYIEKMSTMFILTSLNNLMKNGRISKTKGLIATALKFVPIMWENDGNIELFENVRGNKKAFARLVEIIGEKTDSFKEQTLAISHVNSLEKAEYIKEKAEELYDFKEVLIFETKGLSSSYADDGGIILSY